MDSGPLRTSQQATLMAVPINWHVSEWGLCCYDPITPTGDLEIQASGLKVNTEEPRKGDYGSDTLRAGHLVKLT